MSSPNKTGKGKRNARAALTHDGKYGSLMPKGSDYLFSLAVYY